MVNPPVARPFAGEIRPCDLGFLPSLLGPGGPGVAAAPVPAVVAGVAAVGVLWDRGGGGGGEGEQMMGGGGGAAAHQKSTHGNSTEQGGEMRQALPAGKRYHLLPKLLYVHYATNCTIM